MEDILSLDDEVLQDTYLYHLPPDDKYVRLAPLLWRRIRYDLMEYMVETKADGIDVFTWYHRQFIEAARDRYVTEACHDTIHANMSEYYLGIWYDKPKPLELYKKKTGSYPNAMRQVPAQPNTFGLTKFNVRKLNALPYHLTLSGNFADFVTHICRNFAFLYNKCVATSIDTLLRDMRFAINKLADEEADEICEMQFLYEMLILRSDLLRKDPLQFPAQV